VTFDEVLEQALEMLRRRGRVSYRALQVQFQLDDTLLEILKDEIVEVPQLAMDQEGKMLVWTGDTASSAVPTAAPAPDHGRAPLAYTPSYLAEKILTSRSALECLRGETPRGQPWPPACTLPHGRDGLRVRCRATCGPCGRSSLGRPVHRPCLRTALPDVTTLLPATPYHQSHDVEAYRRSARHDGCGGAQRSMPGAPAGTS
jgi:hypothetical protein